MDLLLDVLKKPFTLGLLLGLAFAVVIAVRSWIKRRSLVKENRLLREQLQACMSKDAQRNLVDAPRD
jgi:hypothetical protein